MDRDTMVFPGATLVGVWAPLPMTAPTRYFAAARMDMDGDDANDGWFVHPDHADTPGQLTGLFRICSALGQDAAILALTPAVRHREPGLVWCDAVVVGVLPFGWRRHAGTPGECTVPGRHGLRRELLACVEADDPRGARRPAPAPAAPAPAGDPAATDFTPAEWLAKTRRKLDAEADGRMAPEGGPGRDPQD